MIKPEEIAAIRELLDEMETPESPSLQPDASTVTPYAATSAGQPGQPMTASPSSAGTPQQTGFARTIEAR